MIDELEVLLRSAVTGVLRTALNLDVRVVPVEKESLGVESHIASCVGFIGRMTGVVYLYAQAQFAARMTGIILGLGEKEFGGDEMVNDAMGELANMVVGNFKAALAERGQTCVLTIPSIVRGSNFSIESVTSTTRRVLCFRCNSSDNLVVEILIKPLD